MKIVGRVQQRIGGKRITVVESPLQKPDPQGGLRQIHRVGVHFQTQKLFGTHDSFKTSQTAVGGETMHAFFQVFHQLQRNIKEIAAAASGIEYSNSR